MSALQLEKRISSKQQSEVSSFLGHKTNALFYVIIFALVLSLFGLLILHIIVTNELRERYGNTQLELALLENEFERLQDSYSIVLADVVAFKKLHNLTNSSGASFFSNSSASSTDSVVISTDNSSALHYYYEQGVFSTSCLVTTKLIATPTDRVDFVLVAHAPELSELRSPDAADSTNAPLAPLIRVFIDAQEVAKLSIESSTEGIYRFSANIPKGTHYLDLVHSGPSSSSVEFSLLRAGDRTLDLSSSTLDVGSGLAAFDCANVRAGSVLDTNGALRLQLEKV